MGIFVNSDNSAFQVALNSEIYIDKTGLLTYTNKVMNTLQGYICNSRPRRFGKSITADMLTAYYSKGCDSGNMFSGLEISQSPDFKEHLNRYDVIHWDIQWCIGAAGGADRVVSYITEKTIEELRKYYSEVIPSDPCSLPEALSFICNATKNKFVVIIDEWDVLIRDMAANSKIQDEYISFLRGLFKGTEPTKYIQLAYLTGILPIKKEKTQSALNNFDEFTMLSAGRLSPYIGFTEAEVKELSERYQVEFDKVKAWYDGYELVTMEGENRKTYSMYSPKSVVDAMLSGVFDNYWNQTETYEALKAYIRLNFDGLKDSVIRMLAGDKVQINTGTFSNDMTTFQGMDDVLTLLVHLGYLSYHWPDKTVSIPNKEVSQEYVNAISTMDWKEVIQSIEASRNLLEALWQLNAEAVANGIDQAHQEISILQYNDENALSCTISLAFYFAREYYTIIRELPTGKGFADLCFIPRRLYADKPAAVIELKWDKKAEGAISQIKNKGYVDALKDYHGDLLLAGINYDKKTKKHTCVIEKYNK